MLFPDFWRVAGGRAQGSSSHTMNSRARIWFGSWPSLHSAGNKCTNLAAAWNMSTCHFSSFVGGVQFFSIYAATSSCGPNTSMHSTFAQEEA